MEFSNTSNKALGIVQDIDFLVGSTSASYPLADKVRNVNFALQEVAPKIWEADGAWQFDDTGNTDIAKATRTMADASAFYAIPTTVMEILGVEVKDNNGDWLKLKPIDYHDLSISPEEYLESAGKPVYYDLQGNNVRLFPPPGTGDVTLSSGLCLKISRDINLFTTASTTTSPGFATPFHRILSISAALDFEKDPSQRNLLIQMRDRLERGLIKFYAHRGLQQKAVIKPFGRRRWRQYK